MPTKPNVEGWNEESEKIISCFLLKYGEGSEKTYINAFRRIQEHTAKSNIKVLTLEDYKMLSKVISKNYMTMIFKFLYAFDYLENPKEIASEFGNKEKIKEKFDREKKDSTKPYTPAIPAQDLDRIINFVEEVKENDFENVRLAFCFYILFYKQIQVNQLKKLDAKDYKDKKIILKGVGEIEIPEKFDSFLQDLKKNKNNTKFTIANDYITELGREVGIKNLVPKDIVEASKQRFITCPECGHKYLATLENWISVNNYLMCKACLEKLSLTTEVKKNRIIDNIQNYEADFSVQDEVDFIEQDEPYNPDLDLTNQDVSDFDSMNLKNPESRMVTINRLVRDTKKSRELKEKYKNKCQLCGCQLRSANGQFMSEAHHIQPYNKTHKGNDTKGNLIILCPNHHAQFDQLYYAIEPYTHKVNCLFNDDQYHLKIIVMAPGHSFGKEEHLKYIWNKFCERKKQIADFIQV